MTGIDTAALRRMDRFGPGDFETLRSAADEIDELRTENATLRVERDRGWERVEAAEKEIRGCAAALVHNTERARKAEARLASVEALIVGLDNAIDYGAPEDDNGEKWTPLSPVVALIDAYFDENGGPDAASR